MKNAKFLLSMSLEKLLLCISSVLLFYNCSGDDAMELPPKEPVKPVEVLLPEITEITPLEGKPGTVVTITGNNFGEDPKNITFHFNGIEATINKIIATELQVIVPMRATTGKVLLTVNKNKVEGAEFTITPMKKGEPIITGLSPSLGSSGTLVSVEGANLGTNKEETTFFFGGIKAEIKSITDTKIEVVVPEEVATAKVIITTKEGKSEGPEFSIIVLDKIEFLSVTKKLISRTPLRVDHAGSVGNRIRISIKQIEEPLFESLNVFFNGVKAEITKIENVSWDIDGELPTLIDVKVPEGATTGELSITTKNAEGIGPDFLVIPIPTIISIEPSSAKQGSIIRIKGENFNLGSAVLIGDNHVQVTTRSETEIEAVITSKVSSGKIRIKNIFHSVEGPEFEVLPDFGDNFYAVGEKGKRSIFGLRGVYWRNNETFYLGLIPASIALSGSDIHIVGREGGKAIYLKNGEQIELDDLGALSSKAKKVLINKGDTYILGEVETTKGVSIIVWKNGIPSIISGENDVQPIDMAVSGDNVHIIGVAHKNFRGIISSKYWKNGVITDVSDKLKFSITQKDVAIAVNGEDVYIGGTTSDNKGRILKNGEDYITLNNRNAVEDIKFRGNELHYIARNLDGKSSSYYVNKSLREEIPILAHSLSVNDGGLVFGGRYFEGTQDIPAYYKDGKRVVFPGSISGFVTQVVYQK